MLPRPLGVRTVDMACYMGTCACYAVSNSAAIAHADAAMEEAPSWRAPRLPPLLIHAAAPGLPAGSSS